MAPSGHPTARKSPTPTSASISGTSTSKKAHPSKSTPIATKIPACSSPRPWSPDSKWLTYSKFLESHLRAIFVYSLDTAKVSQVTASIGDARYPVFDKSGKYLFFAASTDVGLSAGWLDLSSYQHPILRSVYAIVLKAGEKSPVEPESDEEKGRRRKRRRQKERRRQGFRQEKGRRKEEGRRQKEARAAKNHDRSR